MIWRSIKLAKGFDAFLGNGWLFLDLVVLTTAMTPVLKSERP